MATIVVAPGLPPVSMSLSYRLVSCRLVGVHVHVCPWEPMLCSRKHVSDTFGGARAGSSYLLLPDVRSLLLSGSPSALYWHQLSSSGEVFPWGVAHRQGGFGASSCPGGVPHRRTGAPLGPSSELVLNPPPWCRLLLHRRRGLPNWGRPLPDHGADGRRHQHQWPPAGGGGD